MTERAADCYGLPVGRLEEGGEADFILFDPDEEWIVDRRELLSKSKNTPYNGVKLSGRVKATFLRGRLTWRDET
jgi:dihydroorotase